MIIMEEKIRSWTECFFSKSDKIKSDCTNTYFDTVTVNNYNDQNVIESALASVKKRASVLLTSDDILNDLSIDISDPNAKEAFRRSWYSLMPKLAIPAPSVVVELASWQLAVAAALGSLLGMFLMGGLLRLWLDMRETGIILGGITGAASFVYGIWYAAHSTTVRTSLTALIGVSASVEIISMFYSIGPRGIWNYVKGGSETWSTLKGAIGSLKRVSIYIAIILLLIFARRGTRYDEESFRPIVEHDISQWIDYGILLLLSLSSEQNITIHSLVFDPSMARSITNLHATSADDLPLGAEAVLQEARRLGLSGLDSPPLFINQHPSGKRQLRWEITLKQYYNCFGLIEEGDVVIVEEEPVVQNGIVIDMGRVRKFRQANSKGDE